MTYSTTIGLVFLLLASFPGSGLAQAKDIGEADLVLLLGYKQFDGSVIVDTNVGECVKLLADVGEARKAASREELPKFRKACSDVLAKWLAVSTRNPKKLTLADLESREAGLRMYDILDRQRRQGIKMPDLDGVFRDLNGLCGDRKTFVETLAKRGVAIEVPVAVPEVCTGRIPDVLIVLKQSKREPVEKAIARSPNWYKEQRDALAKDVKILKAQLQASK